MYSKTIVAVLGLAAITSGHMIMNTPVPYGLSTLDNSPLAADGSDFPCKQRTGVYAAEGASNTLALGSTQNLEFTGSATHGGGSCQVSITYDLEPTTSSVFKVIHSIEGGCPVRDQAGNLATGAGSPDPDTYNFTVPTTLTTGSATLVWTWFNKVGNREMYMNCAPVNITGSSSSKRSDENLISQHVTEIAERDNSAYDALPNMFVANIGNGCGTVDSTDLLFPDPGDSVEQDGLQTSSALSTPTGSCAKAINSAASSTAGGSVSSATESAQSSTAAPQVTASTSPVVTSTAETSTASDSDQGGVFATVASESSTSSAAEATSEATSPAAGTSAASSAVAATTSASPATGTSAASTAVGTTTSSSGALSGACATDGLWNCIGGTSFQQCASGAWSVVQPVAAGTTCTAGQSTSFTVAAVGRRKRAIRFSDRHRRTFQ